MSTRTTLLILASLSGSLRVASAQTGPQNALPPAMQENAVRAREIKALVHDLLSRAADAEKRSKPRTAETLYQEALALRPALLSIHTSLARLYDRQGRDREAYMEYRALVVGRPNSWSSDQEDPVVLARYGDLSLRFGTIADAEKAYRFAAGRSSRDDHWEPQTLPRSESLASLRAAAHAAAAVQLSGGNPDELRELGASIAVDPLYWVPHYYLARAYKRLGDDNGAAKEADMATQLAPNAKYRAMVASLRERRGI